MTLPLSWPKSTVRSFHFYFWGHRSNPSFSSCWCLRSWPRINGSSWLPTVLVSCAEGSKVRSWAHEFWRSASREGICLRGKWCPVHTSSHGVLNAPDSGNTQYGEEKRKERKMVPDSSLQVQETTCRPTAPLSPQALAVGKMYLSLSPECWGCGDRWFQWGKHMLQPLRYSLQL